MNRLEERYRLALRMLPVAYRERWEEDMVEAFMASAETDDPDHADFLADYGRPSWSEVASVAALAVRLRLGLAGTPTPRTDAWRAAVRIVALVWLLSGAAMSLVDAGVRLWTAGLIGRLPVVPAEWSIARPATPWPLADPWLLAWDFSGLMWHVAFATLVLGYVRVARLAALFAVLRSVVALLMEAGQTVVNDVPLLSTYLVLLVLVDVCLLPTLWTISSGPVARARRWAVALAGGVLVVTAWSTAQLSGAVAWGVVDLIGLYAVVTVVAGAVHLARPHLAHPHLSLAGRSAGPRRAVAGRDPSWSLALATLAGGLFVLRLATLPDVGLTATSAGPAPMVAAVVELVTLAAVAVPLAAVAAQGVTRLPLNATTT